MHREMQKPDRGNQDRSMMCSDRGSSGCTRGARRHQRQGMTGAFIVARVCGKEGLGRYLCRRAQRGRVQTWAGAARGWRPGDPKACQMLSWDMSGESLPHRYPLVGTGDTNYSRVTNALYRRIVSFSPALIFGTRTLLLGVGRESEVKRDGNSPGSIGGFFHTTILVEIHSLIDFERHHRVTQFECTRTLIIAHLLSRGKKAKCHCRQ